MTACIARRLAMFSMLLLAVSAVIFGMGEAPRETPAPPLIGNKGSRKVHLADCVWGQKIPPGKRIYFNSYEEAEAAGYVSCHVCNPGHIPTPPPPVIAPDEIVASSVKSFFHRGSCPWAKKITAEHLIRYRTRDEAIAAGKSPCRACKP